MKVVHFEHSLTTTLLFYNRVRLRIRQILSFAIFPGLWFMVGVVVAGCGKANRRGDIPVEIQTVAILKVDGPPEESDDISTEIDSTKGDLVFTLLTSRSWTNRAPNHQYPDGFCPVGEGDSEFRFLASGEYKHQWHPCVGGEPAIKTSGRWMLQQGHDKKWLACFDSGERHPVTLFDNGSIQLDGLKYPLRKLEPAPNVKSLAEMDVVVLPDEVRKRIAVLTSREWHRANDVNLDGFPTKIAFRDDFTFVAHSASGREFPVGTWYATLQSALASAPRDSRGEGDYLRNYGTFLRIEIDHADQLIIERAPYVPKERLGSKGTIWHFGGYENVRVQVDYDMPIRRGVPCQFDIHFIGAPELTLERFSITKEYDHGYRRPDGTLAPVEEMAALDLKETYLQAGESKSFKFTATFPQSGDHSYYLNAMLRGATQPWDERQAMTFRVLEPE